MKKTVLLILGGEGYERDISIKSAENLSRLIDKDKYKLLTVEISKSGAWYLRVGTGDGETDATLTYPVLLGGASGILVNGVLIHIDAAVIALHGDHGEDGAIQGALTAAHIKYIGQDVYAAAATSDKAFTKLIAERLGIRTAKWLLSVSEDKKTARIRAEKALGYPMFIKPARLGSSFGAHPVRSREDFDSAYLDAKGYGGGRVLIEELIDISYELECALFDDGVRIISPSGRILSDGRFYDFSSKYESLEKITEVRSDGRESAISREAERLSGLLADAIGLKYMSRIDFFVTRDGTLVFNEINTVPGMTDTSLYPAITEEMGLSRGEFINRLIGCITEDDGCI